MTILNQIKVPTGREADDAAEELVKQLLPDKASVILPLATSEDDAK